MITKNLKSLGYPIQTPLLLIVGLVGLLISVPSLAVEPIEDNFKFALDVQGQRINVYDGCGEGRVTCDDMLIEAPDLRNLKNLIGHNYDATSTIKYYPAHTHHSLCKDGVTPCGFQGYSFAGHGIKGFIDDELTVNFTSINPPETNQVILPAYTLFKPDIDYAHLHDTQSFIDTMYNYSDAMINASYTSTLSEVNKIYGQDFAKKLKKDQINWIVERSKKCGADKNHLPRNQIEKGCFHNENMKREAVYFLWID